MVSPFMKKFIEESLYNKANLDYCVDIVDYALDKTTHLVRVRSVARAAGFCAFYGRMAEKMGVYEVLEGGSVVRGRDVHRILGLASLNLFSEHPNPEPELVESYVSDAVNELRDFFSTDEQTIKISTTLLKRLINALPKARRLLGLRQDEVLFPIVEQSFADYRSRMYGAPDLILESREKGKAIVVEWKTYALTSQQGQVSEYEIAQVIAYSIIEARRLGIAKLRDVLESITGVPLNILKELAKDVRNARKSGSKITYVRSNAVKPSERLLRILPLIVTPRGGYPPHPSMYKWSNPNDIAKRLTRMYRLFKGVLVAAEYLTLQITNIPALLKPKNTSLREFNERITRDCRASEGNYPVYSYTPFTYLRRGRPGNWNEYPCRMCYFKGNEGPCEFYFGGKRSRDKDYFDKLMWWARYTVFSERERDLINHRAMHELFRNKTILSELFSEAPKELQVSIGGRIPVNVSDKRGFITYLVRVSREQENLGKFRFDLFDISNVIFDADNSTVELSRSLRDVERGSDVVGLLRKSLHLAIIEPNIEPIRVEDPLLSISTFVMIDEAFVSDGKVVYRCYCPSQVLLYNFMLFGKYLELYKRMNPYAKLLAYETPVDLTIMELRTIDALHRYLKEVAETPKYLEQLGISAVDIQQEDLKREPKILRIPSREDFTTIRAFYELLREKIFQGGKK